MRPACPCRRTKGYEATVTGNHYLGYYNTAEEAAIMADWFVYITKGPSAQLNVSMGTLDT
jgi:hypothetical protein